MTPPNAKSVSSAKDPKVFATIMFLPVAAINRNSADAIWLISKSRKYCLKNLKCFLKENKHHLVIKAGSEWILVQSSQKKKTKKKNNFCLPFNIWIESNYIIG